MERQSKPWFCSPILVADPVCSVASCEGIKGPSWGFVATSWRQVSGEKMRQMPTCLWRSNFVGTGVKADASSWKPASADTGRQQSGVSRGLLGSQISVLASIHWEGLWMTEIKYLRYYTWYPALHLVASTLFLSCCLPFIYFSSGQLGLPGVKLIFDRLFSGSCQLFILFLPLLLFLEIEWEPCCRSYSD